MTVRRRDGELYLVIGEDGDEQKKCRVFEMKFLGQVNWGRQVVVGPATNGNFDARRLPGI